MLLNYEQELRESHSVDDVVEDGHVECGGLSDAAHPNCNKLYDDNSHSKGGFGVGVGV